MSEGLLLSYLRGEVAVPSGPTQPLPVTPPPGPPLPGGGDLFREERVLRDPHTVIENCRHMKFMGGGGYQNWRQAVRVLTYCKLGLDWAQALSIIGYDDKYDPAAVQAKFISDGDGAPITCAAFNKNALEARQGWCAKCEQPSMTVTTPLLCKTPHPDYVAPPVIRSLEDSLLHKDDAKPVELWGFQMTSEGIFWSKDPGKPQQKICDRRLIYKYCKVWREDGYVGRAFVFDSVYQGQSEEVTFDTNLHLRAMDAWLLNNKLMPEYAGFHKPMKDFMQAYIASLQNKGVEKIQYGYMGWQEDRQFLIGSNLITPEETKPVDVTPRILDAAQKEYISSGTVEEWKGIADIYRQLDQKVGQLFICAGFAAPFMKYGMGTATNAIFSLFDSKGGKGKTSLLHVVNSIWGHPTALNCTGMDTLSARYQVLGGRRNLPVCIDEITMLSHQEVVTMLYTINSGREKRKATSGVRLAQTGSWDTCTFFSSNTSLQEMILDYSAQANAPAMRVIEFECDFADYSGTPQGQLIYEAMSSLRKNYGVAGPHFMRAILKQPDGIIQKYIQDFAALWLRQAEAKAEERFWVYGLGIALATGHLMKRCGLVDYDIDALGAWTKSKLLAMRVEQVKQVEAATGTYIIRQFLNEHLDDTLIVATGKRKPGRKDSNSSKGIELQLDDYIRQLPTRKLYVRIEEEDQLCHISWPVFRTWCTGRRLSANRILKELMHVPGLMYWTEPVSFNLGRGVEILGRGQTKVITLRTNYMERQDDN